MEHTVYQAQLLEPKFWSIKENGVRCFYGRRIFYRVNAFDIGHNGLYSVR